MTLNKLYAILKNKELRIIVLNRKFDMMAKGDGKMKELRIFVVIPTWGLQGKRFDTNNFFINQALALQRAGHRPEIISVRLLPIKSIRTAKLCQKASEYELHGMKLHIYDLYVPFPTRWNALRDKYISWFYHKILCSHIKKEKQNRATASLMIHAHVSHECGYYCLECARKERLPLVVTEHYSGLLTGAATKNDYARVSETVSKADAFVFVGTHFKESICEKLNVQNNVFVVPNMVNTERYTICEDEKEEFVFLTAGTLKKNKRMDLVIQAFSEEFREEKNVTLLIAGDGVERKNLEEQVSALGVTDKVHFLGEYQIDQAGELFSHSDAFVLTSEFETFGIVYVEALFCGLPCIGTKGQGPDDIINDKNGFLVNHGNVPELKRAMRHLYDKRYLYSKEELRREAIDRFSEENISRQLTTIYESVLEREIYHV